MGYHWLVNTDPALSFNGLMFRTAAVVAVMLKKVRYAMSHDCIIEKNFPDEVNTLRIFPFQRDRAPGVWIRTQNERTWRRFYILPETTAEIEFNTAENYREHPTSGRGTGKKPLTGSISLYGSLLKTWLKRGMKSNNPYKCSVWQTDEGHFFRTGNCVHPLGKC